MLNTVWICIAEKQSLIDRGILDRGGLFQSAALSAEGFDQSQFIQGNKRELELIPLNTKKYKIMTNHPTNSYEVEETEDGNKVLRIKDKDAFWSMSNYLVVSIK